MRRLIMFLAASASFAAVSPVHAGIVVSFQSPVTLTAGSASPTDLVVNIAGEPLNEINLAFTITRGPGNAISPTYLPEFITPSSPATDPTFHDPNYVFGIDSALAGSQVFGTAGDPGNTGYNNTFTGGDFAFSDVAIGPNNNVLARLQMSALGILNPTNAGPDGDTFVIALDLVHSSFYSDSGQIFDISAGSGTINVTPQAHGAVPEPSGLVLTGIASVVVAFWTAQIRRRRAVPC